MNIELSTGQELAKQIDSIELFVQHLSDMAEESPERVYIFANRLKNAIEKLEKNTKDRAIVHQETYGELGAGYALKLSTRAKYTLDSPEYLIAKKQFESLKETEELKIDLEEKEKGFSDKKSYTPIYSIVTPK